MKETSDPKREKGIFYKKTIESAVHKKARRGFGDIMGGKVLELESDRLIKQGLRQGMTIGKPQRN